MAFERIKNWWQSLWLYVVADPADNSITLSKALFEHIRRNAKDGDAARVFVFKVKGGDYAFMANPRIEQPTQMCDIQYNDRYRCVGFETLCPSVGQMLYDYGLPADRRVKLSASVRSVSLDHDGDTEMKFYYLFHKPNAEHIRKYTQG